MRYQTSLAFAAQPERSRVGVEDSTGQRTGELAFALDGDAVDDGGPIPTFGPTETECPSWQICDEHVLVPVQLVQGEDREITGPTGFDHTSVLDAKDIGQAPGDLVDGAFERKVPPLAHVTGQEQGRVPRCAQHLHMGPGIR